MNEGDWLFTGLVQEIGKVTRSWKTGAGRRFVVAAPVPFCSGVKVGDSISVSGCCQTVEELRGGAMTFTAVPETLAKSTLGSLLPGRKVNLERAVTADQGLGGHIVTGHVDVVGEVRKMGRTRGAVELEVSCPAEFLRYIPEKGSIAIDGVSLTVASAGKRSFTVAFIPHTLKHTIVEEYRRGTRVNLEVDILARYAEKLAERDV
jgi:riboflavin synthase